MKAIDFAVIALAAGIGHFIAAPFFIWLAVTSVALLLGRLARGEKL